MNANVHLRVVVGVQLPGERHVDRDAIRAIGQRFGVSRQTFYNLKAKFLAEGTVGLLA